jgi:peptidyl-prolyl cis-trans isomerase C
LPFEACKERVAQRLKASIQARAPRQYFSILAGQAEIVRVDLKGAQTPLVDDGQEKPP